MTTEIKELSRAYQLWIIIKDNPGITMPEIAKTLGTHTKSISDAITKLVKADNITSKGKRGFRTYSVRESNPPEKFGRGSYKMDSKSSATVIFMPPTPGNSVFEECRANWQGYQINKMLEGVRV